MNESGQLLRVGVYVDVANIAQNGGFGMRYNILRSFAAREDAIPIRLNAYVVFDEERAKEDAGYRRGNQEFHSVLRDFGYKVIQKSVKWYKDESGKSFAKANADLDMAVDALLQSDNLDRVLIASGDGDFIRVVRALQNKGCRVEVVAFRNVSRELRKEADLFMSGYLVPGLLRVTERDMEWGTIGSRIRGTVYDWRREEGWGFIRFLGDISRSLWITDARQEGSAYKTAFVHRSEFPADFDFSLLPSRDIIFEFDLQEAEKGLQASKIEVVFMY